MLHKITMLPRIAIFCCILSLTISEEIIPSQLALEENFSIPDNQTLLINSTKRAEPLAINISDLFRKYARDLANSNSTPFPESSAKKAYIQDETDNQNQTPAPNQSPIGGLNSIFDSGPNGNIFGQVTVTDLVPYLVQNVLSPLIQRVIVDGNLVNNFSALWKGFGAEESTTQAPVPGPPAEAAPPAKQYVVDIAVAEEETTTLKASPPKRRRTRGSTTTTEKSNGKGDAIEENRQVEAVSSTTSKSKYKLIQRTRTRPSATTQQPFEDNQDDEDETYIFNKLSRL